MKWRQNVRAFLLKSPFCLPITSNHPTPWCPSIDQLFSGYGWAIWNTHPTSTIGMLRLMFFVSTFLLHSYLRLSSSVWSATAEGNNLGAAATNSSFRRRPRFSSCKRRKNKKQKVICDVFLRHNRNGRLQDMWVAVLGKTTLNMIAAAAGEGKDCLISLYLTSI